MSDKFSFEMDLEFLDEFYALAEAETPKDLKSLRLTHLKDTLPKIKMRMDKLVKQAQRRLKQIEDNAAQEALEAENKNKEGVISSAITEELAEGAESKKINEKTVLIIDDLGVITYQLSILFKKIGFEVTSSQEIYDAVAKYKKQKFSLVIMDLYIPTEREGYLLLDELKKLNTLNAYGSIIGVVTASSKKEHKVTCLGKGADFFMEKIDDWQNILIKYCEKY